MQLLAFLKKVENYQKKTLKLYQYNDNMNP